MLRSRFSAPLAVLPRVVPRVVPRHEQVRQLVHVSVGTRAFVIASRAGVQRRGSRRARPPPDVTARRGAGGRAARRARVVRVVRGVRVARVVRAAGGGGCEPGGPPYPAAARAAEAAGGGPRPETRARREADASGDEGAGDDPGTRGSEEAPPPRSRSTGRSSPPAAGRARARRSARSRRPRTPPRSPPGPTGDRATTSRGSRAGATCAGAAPGRRARANVGGSRGAPARGRRGRGVPGPAHRRRERRPRRPRRRTRAESVRDLIPLHRAVVRIHQGAVVPGVLAAQPVVAGGTYAYPSRSRPRRDALIAAAGSRSCLRAGRCEVARTSRERKPRAAMDARRFGARTSGACVDDS